MPLAVESSVYISFNIVIIPRPLIAIGESVRVYKALKVLASISEDELKPY